MVRDSHEESEDMKKCFIFGALPVKKMNTGPEEADLIIAADRGYENALRLGVKPDITVGDFDSLGHIPDAENIIKLPIRKDETDIGYAVKLGFERGYTQFEVYGAVGGLLDHTFANIAIALDIAERGGRAWFYGNDISFTVIRNSTLELPAKGSGRVSIFALGSRCDDSDNSETSTARGVTIKGLSYEAEDIEIKCSDHIGVSNEFIGKPASISVKDGALLIMVQNKNTTER